MYNARFINTNAIPGTMIASTDPTAQNEALSLGENTSVVTKTQDFGSLDWPTSVPIPRQYRSPRPGHPPVFYDQRATPEHISISSTSQIAALVAQSPTPSIEDSIGASTLRPRASRRVIVPSQANLPGSKFQLYQSRPIPPLAPDSPDLRLSATCNSSRGADKGFNTGREGLAVELQSSQPSSGQHLTLMTSQILRILKTSKPSS
ncbi:hypothetical protein B0J17DRAFT_713049 [Rhizoctonia solani]|nr:hypothetical protein B0J17DRAFT_713049 [Rhizoctonia solani]